MMIISVGPKPKRKIAEVFITVNFVTAKIDLFCSTPQNKTCGGDCQKKLCSTVGDDRMIEWVRDGIMGNYRRVPEKRDRL